MRPAIFGRTTATLAWPKNRRGERTPIRTRILNFITQYGAVGSHAAADMRVRYVNLLINLLRCHRVQRRVCCIDYTHISLKHTIVLYVCLVRGALRSDTFELCVARSVEPGCNCWIIASSEFAIRTRFDIIKCFYITVMTHCGIRNWDRRRSNNWLWIWLSRMLCSATRTTYTQKQSPTSTSPGWLMKGAPFIDRLYCSCESSPQISPIVVSRWSSYIWIVISSYMPLHRYALQVKQVTYLVPNLSPICMCIHRR